MVETTTTTKTPQGTPPVAPQAAPIADAALPKPSVPAKPAPAKTANELLLETLAGAMVGIQTGLAEIKSLLASAPPKASKSWGKAGKGAAEKAVEEEAKETEWARRLAANEAAGRTMSTARYYCGAPGCGYCCYNTAKIEAHVAKKGAPHAKKDV